MRRWIEMGGFLRSRENYYNLNTQNTKIIFFYGAMSKQAGLKTEMHIYNKTNTHRHTFKFNKSLSSFQAHEHYYLNTWQQNTWTYCNYRQSLSTQV